MSLALAACFGLFLFSSAFSIAAAQISLALCLVPAVYLAREIKQQVSGNLRLICLAWGAYVGWLIVSALVNDNPWRSLSAIREEWLIIILPIGSYLHSRPDWSRRLLAVLAAGLLLISCYGVIQHFTGWTLFADQHLHRAGAYWRLSGNFSHPLTYGYYVVSATVFLLTYLIISRRSLGRWNFALLAVATLGGLVAAALCNSRGPVLALAFGLIAAGLVLGRWRWVISVLVALALVLFVLSPGYPRVFFERVRNDLATENVDGRLYIWLNSLRIVEEHPVIGCGPGNFPAAYAEQVGVGIKGSDKGHAHNDFLHQAATAGIPALALYLFLWVTIIRRLWDIRRRHGTFTRAFALASGGLVASVAFFAGSLTEAAIADEELRQVLYALWAAGLSRSGDLAEDNRAK